MENTEAIPVPAGMPPAAAAPPLPPAAAHSEDLPPAEAAPAVSLTAVAAETLSGEERGQEGIDSLLNRIATDDEKLEMEEGDPEDRPTLENILPMKNILHGWSVMAGLVTGAVGQVCHNPTVESAWQMTKDTTSAAAEKTREISVKLADDFSPAVETISSATSSGWATVSTAVREGAAIAAETSSSTFEEIASHINDGSKTEMREAPVTTL